ncbi:MAG: phospho-sugar mutase [Clostridia bacterium]|nr:phospho-sugar mutase [Clostridia bacterium]
MYKDVYEEWLNCDKLKSAERQELELIKDKEDEIEYRFGKDLEFGTAGMRGIIGMGTNMMNVYTVKRASQGLAEYIKKRGPIAKMRGVVISYDTRRFSREFASAAAVVLASNRIRVYLFEQVHPVPMLSFAVRELNCVAGIMITASHNPKEYNGYKVYGSDGAQMSPETTAKVVKYIEKIKSPLSDEIKYSKKTALKYIKFTGKKLDKTYYSKITKLVLSPKETQEVGGDIKLVYTPVHGSGFIPVTTILKKLGIKASIVAEQESEDPDFSTVEVPNPEYKETLSLAISQANAEGADVVFGTDPDCDRLGVAIRNRKGEFVALTGNQTGVLLLDYILARLKEQGELNKKCFVVKSFVTTSLARLIADDYNVEIMEVPVGFKFIGEKIKKLDDTGKRRFVFGFEESCGYLRGTHARDKDAVVASMLFAEMVCYYTAHGVKVYDRLQEIYAKYGYVCDKSVSTVYGGLNAMKEMNAVVDAMKQKKIKKVGGVKVVAKRDYSTLQRTEGDKVTKINSSPVNAVYYELEGGGFICLRPSGTEPKLKVYYSVTGKDKKTAEATFDAVKRDFEELMK